MLEKWKLYLLATGKEELVGVNAVRDGAANEGHPVEDYGRLCGVLKKQLPQYVDHNGQEYEGCDARCDQESSRCICYCIGERAGNLSEDAHFDGVVRGRKGEEVFGGRTLNFSRSHVRHFHRLQGLQARKSELQRQILE